MDSVAQGVGVGKHQGKDTVAAVGVTQRLFECTGVEVGITVQREVAAFTHVAVDGLTQCVGTVYHDGQYAVAAACSTQVLTERTGIPISLIVDGEVSARADGMPYCVADGVAHREVDYQVMEATRLRIAQVLCVNTGTPERSVVLTAHGHAAEVTVGVEGDTGTDNRVYGVAQGVVHGNFDDLDAVAVVVAFEVLVVGTLDGVNRVVVDVRSTGADGVADGVLVRGFHYYTECTAGRTYCSNLGVSVSSMTSFRSQTRGVGEREVTCNSLSIGQITATVEQASRRIATCRG